MASGPLLFDRRRLRANRSAAAPALEHYRFLHREVASRLAERLGDISRPFGTALAWGWDAPEIDLPARSVLYADLAPARAKAAPGPAFAADEEMLPLRDASLGLIVSNLCLHWINDLPGALIQFNRALEPDGLFLGAMLGGDTLIELRQAMGEAEAEVSGGLSPRVSPMAEIRDLGGLLQRAGFAMPVTDADTLTVSYDNPVKLMKDLKGMGEANAAVGRLKGLTRPALMRRAMELYIERHGDAEGRVPATFQVFYVTGWAPGPGQPKPRPPGSAAARLADALGSAERRVPGTKPTG